MPRADRPALPPPAPSASPSRTGTHLPSGASRWIVDRAVFGEEQERLADPLRIRVGLDRDRPGQVAPLRVELVERRNLVGVGDDRRFAQLAQLVEDAQRVDPSPQDVRAGRQRDLVGRSTPARLAGGFDRRRGQPEASGGDSAHLLRLLARGARGFVLASGPSESGLVAALARLWAPEAARSAAGGSRRRRAGRGAWPARAAAQLGD